MKYELDLYDKWNEGRTEGLKEGIEQGRKEGIEQGVEKGIEIGETKGMATGREEGAIQIAIAMLKDNVEFETIAQYTRLPIETIKKLAPQMTR